MGRTMIEKILSRAAGYGVHAGDAIVASVDRVLLQDGTAKPVFDRLEQLALGELKLASRSCLYFDHAAPPPTPEIATSHELLRQRCAELGIELSEIGQGISHQRMVEAWACPGEVIVGADSHTCTAGALGCVALGMGSTDVACTIALGETWLLVPGSVKIELVGELRDGVTAKDAMLSMVGRLGATGADYMALEFDGPGLDSLDQESRFVMSNLAAEVGAKTGMVPSDEITHAYLKSQGRGGSFEIVLPDPDAEYDRHLKLDLSRQKAVVARPGRHDQVVPVKEVVDEPIQQVVIGSCTNGRASDFAAAARILEGHRIHSDVRLLLAPASAEVLKRAMDEGSLPALIAAGGILITPGCGPCVGIHQGVLGEGQSCLATQSRNFPGRMGAGSARIWLGSPMTAAATALAGKLSDPRRLLRGT